MVSWIQCPPQTVHLVKGTVMLRVLVVDDSLLICERIGILLSELEQVDLVGQAQDTLGARAAVRRLKPDVVIMEVCMPGGSGLCLLEDIKRMPAAPAVIVLTAYPRPQYRARCLEAGAAYFFDNSAEFSQLPRVLTQLDGARDKAHGKASQRHSLGQGANRAMKGR